MSVDIPHTAVHTMSEVVDVKGYVGNFNVKILKKATLRG